MQAHAVESSRSQAVLSSPVSTRLYQSPGSFRRTNTTRRHPIEKQTRVAGPRNTSYRYRLFKGHPDSALWNALPCRVLYVIINFHLARRGLQDAVLFTLPGIACCIHLHKNDSQRLLTPTSNPCLRVVLLALKKRACALVPMAALPRHHIPRSWVPHLPTPGSPPIIQRPCSNF